MKITKQSNYYEALSKIEAYIEKGFSELTTAEEEDLKNLSVMVENFEIEEFPMPLKMSLKDLFKYIMSKRDLNQNALAEALEVPKSSVSEYVSGKKKLTFSMAQKLHKVFKIDGNLILDIEQDLSPSA